MPSEPAIITFIAIDIYKTKLSITYTYIYIYVSHIHVCCCCSCCCCCFCLSKNSTSCKNFKMLQILTDINNFQRPIFKLQNSIYIFDLNIVAFQPFFVSCFGQWGCRFVWKICTWDYIVHFLCQIHYNPILFWGPVTLSLLVHLLTINCAAVGQFCTKNMVGSNMY